uniref:Uncharacterized protein n=2 Tax=Opuntia streptacantha TaxID=393608 RepID=A0A7C9AIN9_OPUST
MAILCPIPTYFLMFRQINGRQRKLAVFACYNPLRAIFTSMHIQNFTVHRFTAQRTGYRSMSTKIVFLCMFSRDHITTNFTFFKIARAVCVMQINVRRGDSSITVPAYASGFFGHHRHDFSIEKQQISLDHLQFIISAMPNLERGGERVFDCSKRTR